MTDIRMGDRARVVGMFAFVALLHAAGWGTFVLLVGPLRPDSGGSALLNAGLAVTAYTLGMRHAFDADHIAAIDNTTRRLLASGRRPQSVGFWFALGHSSVVFALCALLALGFDGLLDEVGDESSQLQETAAVTGTLVSGTFLILIALLNVPVLLRVWRDFQRLRRAKPGAPRHQEHVVAGLLSRVFARAFAVVKRPGHLYPLGVLFGLGFDTATEIALLVAVGGAAVANLPWYAIMVLPLLFAAGMALFDTLDSCLMTAAYGWAHRDPMRTMAYSAAVTAASLILALTIGLVELVGLSAEMAQLSAGPLAWIAELDLGALGFIAAGALVTAWLVVASAQRAPRGQRRLNTVGAGGAE